MEPSIEKKQEILKRAHHKIEFEELGLSKDDKKAVNAYEDIIQKGLAVFKGKPLKPVVSIDNNEVSKAIDDLIKEDQKELLGKFKNGFRDILKKKIELDKILKQKQIEFNKAVVNEKKQFTKAANEVMALVDNMNNLKEDYLKALAPAPDQNDNPNLSPIGE